MNAFLEWFRVENPHHEEILFKESACASGNGLKPSAVYLRDPATFAWGARLHAR